MNPNPVYALVTLATLFWGANFVLAGPVLADLPPLWAAAARFVLGTALMVGIARWRGEDLAGPARRHAWTYGLLGTIGIGAFNLLFFYALQHTSADNAALIMATNPLLTVLIAAVLLGERPTARHLAALPVALFGVGVVISEGDLRRLASLHVAPGDLLMLGANLAWALYNVLGRRYMPQGSLLTNTTLVMGAGAALLLAVALGSGTVPALPGTQALVALALMASLGTVLAYLLWNTGIAHLGAGRTALFLNLVPVFAMLIGTLGGMPPTTAQMLGGLFVLGGVTLSMLPQRRLALT